ncbi:hypothetical protein CABS01_02188 [Colletotrichum abscissum]|uniref:Apple domain-containing protein n=1 Tax=Colletotrichum abscissum TaxID=1671311 RepID=A0A9P9XIM2_9PEZI|nr:uncharacterized protein CABS01_02188 [Colletotrichum abscissum]KAI3554459.1 hypothetical protein CABS02_05276 [Colletotrichum abscissum]KAK1488558.1 hypothetical protein CABS01_02188 [Colletotrichum abscissum]
MHFSSAALLLTPSIIGALAADQAPLTSDNGSCLSSPSYKSCCPTQNSSGEGGISGSTFEYTCGSWPSAAVKHADKSLTPAHCAEICARDPQCVAGAWSSGACYITKDPAYKRFGPGVQSIILLVKTDDAFEGSTSGGSGRQNAAECEREKDAIQSQMASQCDIEKQKLQTGCKDDVRTAEESCNQEKTALETKAATLAREKTLCEADKARELTVAKAQCDADRSRELTDARTQCDAEKSRELTDAKTQCDALKSAIEKQLQQCQNQQDQGKNNQQGSPQEAECKTTSWQAMCGSRQCADRFSIEGVEYERRCGVATTNTRQKVISTAVYRTPWDCLKSECNGVPNCMGIGWTNAFNLCHVHLHANTVGKVLKPVGSHHALFKVDWKQPF